MSTWAVDHALLLAAIGGLYALTLGAYGFTWKVWTWLVDKVETLRTNHMAHLEERVKDIEDRLHDMTGD